MAENIVPLIARSEDSPEYLALDTHKLAQRLSKASELCTKLQALLQNTYGNSGESFRSMADHLQDAYLWQCADLVDEIEGLMSESESMASASMEV